jgi:hypothetical protein
MYIYICVYAYIQREREREREKERYRERQREGLSLSIALSYIYTAPRVRLLESEVALPLHERVLPTVVSYERGTLVHSCPQLFVMSEVPLDTVSAERGKAEP